MNCLKNIILKQINRGDNSAPIRFGTGCTTTTVA